MRSDSDKQLASLAPATWHAQKAAHLARVREWTTARTVRAGRAISHPVYDFLFEYYSFRPAYL
ncbi:MAG: 3-methyladenine DNA glycosylase, partial [bacterium]